MAARANARIAKLCKKRGCRCKGIRKLDSSLEEEEEDEDEDEEYDIDDIDEDEDESVLGGLLEVIAISYVPFNCEGVGVFFFATV